MGRGRVAAALLLALAACAALPATTTANKISINWKPNTNYSDWEQQHSPFYKGDWLVFYYTAGQADVVQVDEVGYNKCDASHAIYNYSKGRSFAFELNETKTYYFICSYGYCYGGMRLAIKSQKLPPPSPPPSSDRSGAVTGLVSFARSHAPLLYAAVAVLAALLRVV
ncbi:early nodulin-like protein 17 [Phragmites australis]|uniref:early nodulin-like protein 17 n=1 Tax=Phragmites australis TaxID=29695 RepID=UPI002D7A2D51|nr:early nodulin-like protein 17 [Phragmites australis]